VYADNGVYTVEVCVTDDDLATTCDTLAVTVANASPVVDAGVDQAAVEGDIVSLDPATFHDQGTADVHAASIDWGDGTATGAGGVSEASFGPPGSTSGADGSVSGSHVYADNGVYTVEVCVTDDDLATTCDTLAVTVANAAPVVDAGVDQAAVEGDIVSLDPATFHDQGTADVHAASIDWGDGTATGAGGVSEASFGPPGAIAGADGSVDGSHVYADNGVYTVEVCVTDDDLATTCDTLAVTVANAAPVVDAGSDTTIVQGQAFDLGASFADAGVSDVHTAVVDWGDGSSEAGTVAQGSGDGTVSASRVYSEAGVFVVEVCVTDNDLGVGCDVLTLEVISPEEGAASAIFYLASLDLPSGTMNSLSIKLDNVLEAFEAGDYKEGINLLGAFTNAVEAQSGKKIATEDAAFLIAMADQIIDGVVAQGLVTQPGADAQFGGNNPASSPQSTNKGKKK
jgi:PKD repeat protein